jgi:hypothetical protein
MLQIEIDGSAQFLAGALPFTLPTANLLTGDVHAVAITVPHPDAPRRKA